MTEVAGRLGVTQSAVSRWEHGYNRPTLALAERLEELFPVGLVEAWYPGVVAGATSTGQVTDSDVLALLAAMSERMIAEGDAIRGAQLRLLERLDELERVLLAAIRAGDGHPRRSRRATSR
jgi:transcriptional regulator with XRE-family HTH domain